MADESPNDKTVSFAPARAAPASERSYLLVCDGDSSLVFHLPATGVILIGRGDDADLQLQEPSASRRHAKLLTSNGEVRVVDLGSHNGTQVNHERVDGARQLASGDVITIGACHLVLYRATPPRCGRQVGSIDELRARLTDEIERARECQRPLAVVSLALGDPGGDGTAAAALAAVLRPIDAVGAAPGGDLAVILPEVDLDAATATAAVLVDAAAPRHASARAGLALYPQDGGDAGALLSAARAAAVTAEPGAVRRALDDAIGLQLGDRTVLIADPAMHKLYELIRRLAASDLPVLIRGETGTGKEHAAAAVHGFSRRAAQPFVAVNCAAISEALIESELFGHERGAFSGAVTAKTGILEAASGGSVFLDEVAELSPTAQAKLLRALETRRVLRVGAVREREVDVRVIAATHRDLEAEVRAGRFRQDLLFRLAAAQVMLPPLRERRREIAHMARAFLDAACSRAGRPQLDISIGAMQRLLQWPWPGNVRELKNTMEYVAAVVADAELQAWQLPGPLGVDDGEQLAPEDAPERAVESSPPAPAGPAAPAGRFRRIAEELAAIERQRMLEALEASGGNRTQAARLLQMPLRTFVTRCKQYGIAGSRDP